MSIIRRIFDKLFGKYLLATNTLTSGFLMGAGDIIQQELEIYRGHHIGPKQWIRYDWQRINRMFWVGLAQGPPQHLFYGFIEHLYPTRKLHNITRKIFLDQCVASPFCIILFFIGMGIMEGRPRKSIDTELKDKFLFVYFMDWMVWPPAQFLNFYFVRPEYRVVYVNFVTMLYDVFLSYAKHDV